MHATPFLLSKTPNTNNAMITFVKTLGGKTHFKAVHIQEPN